MSGVKQWALYRYISEWNKRRKSVVNREKDRSIARDIRASQGWSDTPVIKENRYDLAIVAIFKNEDAYLKEWIEFHQLLGVEHFFLYDNNDDDRCSTLLKPYIEEGLVTHISWPAVDDLRLRDLYGKFEQLSIQNLAYGDFLIRFKDQCRWVMKIDIDEFAYPKPNSLHATIPEFLETLDYRRVRSIEMQEIRFASSGHETTPEGLVIENFIRGDFGDSHKSIANTSFIEVLPYSNCHGFDYKLSYGSYSLYKNDIENELQYNHYYTKSQEEFLQANETNKKSWMRGKKSLKAYLKEQELYDTKEHRDINRFICRLKDQMDSEVL